MTGIFNPPLVKPNEVLDPSQLKRAAALLVARQAGDTVLIDDLTALAEYICTGLIPATQLPWNPAPSLPQLFADDQPIQPEP